MMREGEWIGGVPRSSPGPGDLLLAWRGEPRPWSLSGFRFRLAINPSPRLSRISPTVSPVLCPLCLPKPRGTVDPHMLFQTCKTNSNAGIQHCPAEEPTPARGGCALPPKLKPSFNARKFHAAEILLQKTDPPRCCCQP